METTAQGSGFRVRRDCGNAFYRNYTEMIGFMKRKMETTTVCSGILHILGLLSGEYGNML